LRCPAGVFEASWSAVAAATAFRTRFIPELRKNRCLVCYPIFKLVRIYRARISKTYFFTDSCGEAAKGGGIKALAAVAVLLPPALSLLPYEPRAEGGGCCHTHSKVHSCRVGGFINIKFIRNLQPLDPKAHNGFEKRWCGPTLEPASRTPRISGGLGN